jgi:ADP-heptose:LPS heptosyltransferase
VSPNALITRLDSAGNVLLAGPAIRAVKESGAHVTLLCSSAGLPAAKLLPGIDEILIFDSPWVHGDPPPVKPRSLVSTVWRLRGRRLDDAILLTSSSQSSLPMALMLRLAKVGRITAISDEYPGSLIDNRVRVDHERHEVQRNLAVVEAAGYRVSSDDLRVRPDLPSYPEPDSRYVVLHPGADANGRALDVRIAREAVDRLADIGLSVLVTGSLKEKRLTAHVAGERGTDLGGRTTFGQLAYLLRGAAAAVVGDADPAHLAASVGTPVVSLFPPATGDDVLAAVLNLVQVRA